MVTQTQVVRFTKSTGANGTTQDVTFSFTPKAIIVTSAGAATDNSSIAHHQLSYGFSDGTNQACVTIGSEDAAAAADAGRSHRTDSCFARLSESAPNNTLVCRGSAAFGTNKVTFTWTVNDAVATIIDVWAIAGDDITNVKVNTVDVGRTTTGTQSYTGLGFTPQGDNKSVIFSLQSLTQSAALNTVATTANVSWGCSTKAIATAANGSNQWIQGINSEHAADPSDTWRLAQSDRNIISMDLVGGYAYYGYHSAWISDGFQITYDGAPSSSTLQFSYLVLNGGAWDSGHLVSPTSITNNVDYTVAVSGQPIRGLRLGSYVTAYPGGIGTVADYSIGTTDGTTSSVQASIDEDAQNNMDSYRLTQSTSILYGMTTNGALNDRGVFDSFGTNSFRLDWPTKSANALMVFWVVVADQVFPVSTTKTHKYNIIQSITKQLTLKTSILQEITKQLTTRFDILQSLTAITKQLTIKFSINQEITKTNTLKTSIIQEITKQLTTKFSVLTPITKQLTVKLSILQEITKQLTTKLSILQAITQTKTHKYNIGDLTQVTNTKTHKYNITGKITRTRTHKYNIEQKITATKTHIFNVVVSSGEVSTLFVSSSAGAAIAITTASTTQYLPLGANARLSLDTVENNKKILYRTDGKISKLYVRIVANGTTSGNSTVKTKKNGTTYGNLSVTIPSGATGVFEDTTNEDVITSGESWVYEIVTSSGGVVHISIVSVLFVDTAASDETITRSICGGTANFTAASGSRYNPIGGDLSGGSATEGNAKTRIRKACTVKNLQVVSASNARTTTTTVKSRINGADGNLSVSIGSGVTGILEDTTNTDTLAAGDDYNTNVATGTGTQTLTLASITQSIFSSSSANNGVCVIGRITGYTQNANTTDYFAIGGNIVSESIESSVKVKTRAAFTFSELTTSITTNSVTASSTLMFRKNGADTALTLSVASSTTGMFSDSSNTVDTVETDEVNTKMTTGATGTSLITRNILVYTYLTGLQHITDTQTHKYNIISAVTKTLNTKFTILQELTKTLNTKFNIVTSVTKQLTVKLNVLQEITKQLTLKTNILQEIVKQLTTKFSIFTPITKQLTVKLDILQEITKQLTTRLDIIGRITETQTHKYNITGKITTTKTHKYNVVRQITATKNHLYNVIGKVTRLRTHKYNVLQAITETNTHKYNITGKITTTRTHKYNIIEQIETNKTHKYDVEPPEGTVSTSKTHKYHVEGKVSTTKTHLYNVLDSIALSATHKYHVLDQALTTKTHKYNVIGRLYTTKTHKYNVIRQVTATKNHLYDVLEASSEVTKNTTHVYNVLVRITDTSTHKYNVIGKTIRLRTHKYNIIARIIKSGTYKFNIIQKITQVRTHKYNLLNRVTPDRTRTHKYNITGKITRLRTHKYNIVGRIYRTRTHKYHMGGKLVVNRIHKFSVGSATGLQELGGSTNAYIRFPERVKIIDIVSNIENIVVANIEIIVSRPPANKAIGVVVIAEYSSRLLTASAYKPRHRIASKQIIPPIIDTIDNVAVAPYIAIEILPLEKTPQFQIRSYLQLPLQKRHYLNLAGQTQLSQDDKTKIRIASATMLQQTQETVIESKAQLEITPFLRPILAPEIMTKHKAKTLKTLINLLSSDHLFE